MRAIEAIPYLDVGRLTDVFACGVAPVMAVQMLVSPRRVLVGGRLRV